MDGQDISAAQVIHSDLVHGIFFSAAVNNVQSLEGQQELQRLFVLENHLLKDER
jgi:hypothetical protein